ncbi:baseplate assembly protein [Pseudomonas aeruginosa]|uniref:baseplate J/gp47 family protein n=2 Tax=Pseudomonas aeruginosa TaxID=287 RepID=UPI001067E801|nr:baseplate assembly protein [Pseudomonas aeruginosa]
MTTNFVAIDLSQLPPPHAVEQLDYEQILAERKAYAISLWPEDQQAEIAARLALESEPLTKLLEENAYREMLWRQRVNEAALANMLASAQGADLDQLAANYNVKRLVIQPGDPRHLDYEQILAERKAYAISLWPEDQQAEIAARLALESEPLTKLLEENAYREMLWRQRVNEAALANMLASAQGADLDQLAANYNVKRLVIQPGDPSKVPPVQELLESDDSLRERAQMAWEGLSTAGPRNSYIFHARAADGRVGDASAVSPSPAVVVVTVQAAQGNGSAPADLLDIVDAYLNDADRRPVADRLTVQSAQVLEYRVDATLYLATIGPESEPILDAARARLTAYVHQRRRLGMEVSESAVHAALHVEGVRKVTLSNWSDIAATPAQAPYCTGITLTLGDE